MNFQIFMILFSFLRELFFDKKEEADFKSKHFKPKRWLAFIFTVITFSTSVFLGIRVINLAHDYTLLKSQLYNCEAPSGKKTASPKSNELITKVIKQ